MSDEVVLFGGARCSGKSQAAEIWKKKMEEAGHVVHVLSENGPRVYAAERIEAGQFVTVDFDGQNNWARRAFRASQEQKTDNPFVTEDDWFAYNRSTKPRGICKWCNGLSLFCGHTEIRNDTKGE